MTKRSGKWCVFIALISLLRPLPASADDPSAAAGDAAGAARGRYGSTDALRQNVSIPLTAGGALQSIDGTVSGTVQLTQPASTAFMSMLVQPGATGDLTSVQISQDTDFNGNPDYAFSLPMRVSGVCADGVISCDAGTWLHCDSYRWIADGDGKVSLTHLGGGTGGLGGCYCINSSCGSNLVWDNLGLVLKDLGGGAAGAIQQQKDGYVITRVAIEGPSIIYYGQNTANPGGSGSNPQTQYLDNAAAVTSDAETMAVNQAADPDSLYSAMLAGFSNRGTDQEVRSCTVQRTIIPAGTSYPAHISGSGTSQTTSPGGWWPNLYHRIEINDTQLRYCNTVWGCGGWIQLNGSGTSQSGQFRVVVSERRIRADFWHGEIGWQNGAWASLIAGGTSSTWWGHYLVVTPEVNGASIRAGGGSPISLTACNPGDVVSIATSTCHDCSTSESINNLCLSMENNGECSLREESVDEVITYQHYNPTNLAPLPSSKTIGEDICAREVTRNWWRKDRVYLCKTDSAFSFAEAGQRVDTVTRSTLDNEPYDTIPYDDLRKDQNTGEWLAESGSIRLPDLPGVEECRNVCKTKKPVTDTQAGPAGVTTDQRRTASAWEFYYKTCDDDGCPLDPGEEVVAACQCINEFAEATSIMSVLDGAAKDMICSDGARK